MATLQGRAIKDTYKDLLQVSTNNNTGVTSSMSTVEDGEGTSSALEISTTGVKVDGTLEVTGSVTGVPHVDYRGNYSGSTAYVADDVVFYNGSSYIAKQSTSGNAPTNTTYWGLLAQKGTDGSNGVNGVNGSNGVDGADGADGADGDGWTNGSYAPATGKVTFTSNDGLGFVTGDLRGSSSNLTFEENASNGFRQIDLGTGGGLMITGKTPVLRLSINNSTGTTDSTTRRDYQFDGSASVKMVQKFKNIQTAEDYLQKYHNAHHGTIEFNLETDITDTTFTHKMDQRFCGKYFMGIGAVRKWTIGDLTAGSIAEVRAGLVLQDIHICVNGNSGNAGNMFGAYEGGFILLGNGVAIELGTDVIFGYGLLHAKQASIYNEANPLELKNNLTSTLLSQPLYWLSFSHAYVKHEVVFSGQFQTCRFDSNSTFSFEHVGMGYTGSATNGSDVGPFIQESSYTMPSAYIANRLPAFIFEGVGNSVATPFDSVTTDVMRYSSVLGQTERYDRQVVGVGMAGIGYANASTGTNAGIVFNASDTSAMQASFSTSKIQTQFPHGSSPYYLNNIAYPFGNMGNDLTHSNFRGWAFWGISGANNLPNTKAFQII